MSHYPYSTYSVAIVAALSVAACSSGKLAVMNPPAPVATPAQASGIDLEYVEPTVRPQDDTYRHLNGKWLDGFELPPDKGVYGAFTLIYDTTQEQLRGLVEGLAATPGAGAAEDAAVAADAAKLADLYASFMDEARLESLGAMPLHASFARVDALRSARDIPALIARFNRTGVGAPYDIDFQPDARDSSVYAVTVGQSGLGLPDRDYYLKDDAKFKDIRLRYARHVETLLGMAGIATAHADADRIVRLETELARLQWTRVENRDPVKVYNKIAVADLGALMPGYDWPAYLSAAGVAGKVSYLIVAQPSYFQGLAELIAHTPLAVWKSYFKWQQVAAAAPYLSKAFVDERFAFTGTVLRGVPENQPRWKRAMGFLDGVMGEAIGRLYVTKYFPPSHKARMQSLVANLLEAYRRDIDHLDWMSPETKQGAREKLSKLVTKIGYPDRWRDYGALQVSRNDLWGNLNRAVEFEYQRNVAKLGKPIDRSEWFMTPQTVNAYYNPVMNEIVFPAAILHPPFFDETADDAMNFGAIVAVIGHEVSHGFDDMGSQYDANGNLRDWFTAEDHRRFAAKTHALVDQYAAYEPVKGYPLNGQLTLGENIADNSGLAVAYKAYQLSLDGRTPPVIDGLTGAQRFYLGWAQVWRGKARENEAIQRVKVDPHSPPAVRGTAPLRNQPGFYEAFGVGPGDHMYLPPEERVSIW